MISQFKQFNEGMKKEREEIHIHSAILLDLRNSYSSKKLKDFEFEYVQCEIVSSDPEDGGADRELIIRRKSDNAFFKLEYTDWDVDAMEMPETLYQVFPREVTTIIYE